MYQERVGNFKRSFWAKWKREVKSQKLERRSELGSGCRPGAPGDTDEWGWRYAPDTRRINSIDIAIRSIVMMPGSGTLADSLVL